MTLGWLKNKIAAKLIIGTLLIVSSVLFFTSLSMIRGEQELLLTHMDSLGTSLAEVGAYASVEAMLTEDYPLLDTIIELMVTVSDVVSVQIERDDGRTIAFAQRENLDSNAEDSTRLFIKAINPSPLSSIELGRIIVTVSAEGMRTLTTQRTNDLIRDSIIAFLLITLLLILMLNLVVNEPIRRLVSMVKKLDGESFDHPIQIKQNDEFGHLANELDSMRLQLKNSYDKVHEQNKELTMHREHLQQKIEEAVAEVNSLSSLLPICANCKSIRDDKGYWERLETYIQQRTNSKFTHSICPDCIEELYPGLMDKE